MARYGKFFSEGITDADDIMATSSDETYTDEVLRQEGFYPIVTVGEPSDSPYKIFRYRLVDDADGGHIEESFTIEKPSRSISKFKLKMAMASAGLLSQFTQLLSSFEVVAGYNALDAFNDATTLDEDNPKFLEAVSLAKQALSLTDQQIEEILSNSVAE